MSAFVYPNIIYLNLLIVAILISFTDVDMFISSNRTHAESCWSAGIYLLLYWWRFAVATHKTG